MEVTLSTGKVVQIGSINSQQMKAIVKKVEKVDGTPDGTIEYYEAIEDAVGSVSGLSIEEVHLLNDEDFETLKRIVAEKIQTRLGFSRPSPK